jgi:hypothetical protein
VLGAVADLRSPHPQQVALGTLRRLVRFDSGNPRSEVPSVPQKPVFHVEFDFVQYVPLLELTVSRGTRMVIASTYVAFDPRNERFQRFEDVYQRRNQEFQHVLRRR